MLLISYWPIRCEKLHAIFILVKNVQTKHNFIVCNTLVMMRKSQSITLFHKRRTTWRLQTSTSRFHADRFNFKYFNTSLILSLWKAIRKWMNFGQTWFLIIPHHVNRNYSIYLFMPVICAGLAISEGKITFYIYFIRLVSNFVVMIAFSSRNARKRTKSCIRGRCHTNCIGTSPNFSSKAFSLMTNVNYNIALLTQ